MNTSSEQSKSISILEGVVEDLSHDGRGVVKIESKVYFVPGALPGETVTFSPKKKRKGQFNGELISIEMASRNRVDPKCTYFGVCGGCTLQHLSERVQISMKQETLLETLSKIGRVNPNHILPPLDSDVWGYRRKARPGCKVVAKKGGVLVGFREQGSSYLTSLLHCDTLDGRLSVLLEPLHRLIAETSCANRIPQIEMAAGDNGVSLVLRHLEALNELDLSLIKEFAQKHKINLFLQPGGLNSIHPLWPEEPTPLFYRLPLFDLEIQFAATDFIQVNQKVNEKMIGLAIDALDLSSDSNVMDLFCGLGNFTLPIATCCASVIGIEGEQALIDKAKLNIARNSATHSLKHVRFKKMDLHNEHVINLAGEPCDRMLLDPPRSGAMDVVTHLVPLVMPDVLVYVSCNPATLARDAEILVHHHGYTLESAGAINMFPHTAHVESIAKFVRS